MDRLNLQLLYTSPQAGYNTLVKLPLRQVHVSITEWVMKTTLSYSLSQQQACKHVRHVRQQPDELAAARQAMARHAGFTLNRRSLLSPSGVMLTQPAPTAAMSDPSVPSSR